MIELVLVVFLLSIAVMATVTVKVGMKAVDFMEATYRFYERQDNAQKQIIELLRRKDTSV
ncbi:MAG: hypothetical protein V1789_00560 [PVC group bacterium]